MAREVDELDQVLVNTNNSATPSHSNFYLVYLSHNFTIILYVFASTSRILILTFAPAHIVHTPRCAVCCGEACGSNASAAANGVLIAASSAPIHCDVAAKICRTALPVAVACHLGVSRRTPITARHVPSSRTDPGVAAEQTTW